jgi:hypothetical protein
MDLLQEKVNQKRIILKKRGDPSGRKDYLQKFE